MELFGAISFFFFFFVTLITRNPTESNSLRMERKSNVKFDRNGNCSSVDSILSLSSMKIIFKKIFFYVLIPRTQRSNSQWRKNPIKFLLVFIKEFLLLLFFFWNTKFISGETKVIEVLELFNYYHRSILSMKIFKKIFFCALIPRIHFRIEFLTARKFLFSLFSFFFWDTKFNDIEFQWQKFLNSLFRSIEIELSSAGNSEGRRKESIDK